MPKVKQQKPDTQIEDALSILDPIKLLVEVQGDAFKITNFKFLEGLKVVKILKDHPNAIPFDIFDMDDGMDSDRIVTAIIAAIAQSGEVIAEIIKLHLKKDEEWMEQLEFDEVLNLSLAIIKANADFFLKTLLPMIPTSIRENFSEEKDS